MATRSELETRLQETYIDHVLTHGEDPSSVYAFCKGLGVSEGEFYDHYASFTALRAAIWRDVFDATVERAQTQEVWANYNVREKALAFFFTLTEELKKRRSFVAYTFQETARGEVPPEVAKLREPFDAFFEPLLSEAIAKSEVVDRRPFRSRYVEPLWRQFTFIVRFWLDDLSNGFERTDEAIEKGINLVFDFLGRSPFDSLVDYGRFLYRNRCPRA